MRDAHPIVPMRGFAAAIERRAADPRLVGTAAIAVGVDEEGGRHDLVLSLRHADGTTLVATLSDEGAGRLADLIGRAFRPRGPGLVPLPIGDRELYQTLTRSKRMPAGEARRAIAELRDVETLRAGQDR